MTDLSIIVPAFNAAGTLEQTLRSVDGQRERGFEVVVVDDGSTDDTAAVARRWCHTRSGWHVVSQPNAGLPAARNAGIRAASGRWIALVDSDDWLLPGHLSRMRALLTSRPNVGLAFADAWAWDQGRDRFARRGALQPYRPRPMPSDNWGMLKALARNNFIFVAAAFPRAVWEDLGGFNEALRSAEDWEMWMRIAAHGHAMAGTAERTAVYRRSPTQMSADPQRMKIGRVAALRAVLAIDGLPADVEAVLRAELQRIESRPAHEDGLRGPLRRLVGRSTRWASPVRDFRFRAPRDVTRALGPLR